MTSELEKNTTTNDIKGLIHDIRGIQVMLDSDVALLYQYETKQLNRAVKRNKNRFPENFCFQLTEEEYKNLRCQNGTSSLINENYGGRRYLPYVFSEYGIAMLAGLLKSEMAIKVSIDIINAFVEMRRFISNNRQVFERLTTAEYKLLEHDKRFDELFDALQQDQDFKQKVFFNGQIYDAYSLIIDIIKQAEKEMVIIDNYIDKSILDMLSKKQDGVDAILITSNKCNLTDLDISKFNEQYPKLELRYSNDFHDRFIIIDNEIIYHVGASLKDLGKKCFGINKIEDKTLLEKLFINI